MADEENSKGSGAPQEEEAPAPAQLDKAQQEEDEVDLLCTQLLRRLNQLRMRKNADIALKQIVDATIAELKAKSKEVQARCYKRQMASKTYTETIAETEVASSKVVATADAVANILNNDVAEDDANDIPEVPQEEVERRGTDEPSKNEVVKAKNKKKRRRTQGRA
jgi:hypothetical protein